MPRRRLYSATLALLLLAGAALACNIPFVGSGGQATETAVNVELAAAQTIAAQQLSVTETSLAQGVDVTQTAQAASATAQVQGVDTTVTALAQYAAATQTALSLQGTELSGAAQATAISQAATGTAQALAATVAAYDAQATAFAQSQTATAQAFVPPPPPPPLPPSSGMIRLSFATGATSVSVQGQIQRNGVIDYVLKALKGQTMLASVYSPGDNVYLGIVGLADGVPLIRTAAGSANFSGVLPATQDYRISLLSPDQKTNYTLQVIIPARIQFAPGAISGTVQGYLRGGDTNFYLLRALKNQTMTVTISSPHNDIFLTIYGMEDGSPLVRSVMGQTTWTGVLPRTQDYMIEAVSTGGNANYTLQVIVQ